jgi:protein phosphatase
MKKACEYQPNKRYQALSEFLHDLTVPNDKLVSKHQHLPLIEKNPLVFWQGVSALLFILIIVEAVFLFR